MTDPIVVNLEVLSTPTFSNIFTTQDTHYLGQRARLVALTNGMAIEIRAFDGTWVRQLEWTEA